MQKKEKNNPSGELKEPAEEYLHNLLTKMKQVKFFMQKFYGMLKLMQFQII